MPTANRKAAASYVDGFVIPVPKTKLAAYRAMAAKAAKIWMEHGALAYVEAAGEDLADHGMVGFLKMAGCKKSETVVFSWITYKSKAHRTAVNAKVMKDPRIAAMMRAKKPPFDYRRMAYGGFRYIVSA